MVQGWDGRGGAMGLRCKRGEAEEHVRNGLMRGKPRARGSRRRGRAGRDVALPQKKPNKLWAWKARDRASGRVVDWECGGRGAATSSRLLERAEERWKPRLYC